MKGKERSCRINSGTPQGLSKTIIRYASDMRICLNMSVYLSDKSLVVVVRNGCKCASVSVCLSKCFMQMCVYMHTHTSLCNNTRTHTHAHRLPLNAVTTNVTGETHTPTYITHIHNYITTHTHTQTTFQCGNGQCESGETSLSCAQDCRGPAYEMGAAITVTRYTEDFTYCDRYILIGVHI